MTTGQYVIAITQLIFSLALGGAMFWIAKQQHKTNKDTASRQLKLDEKKLNFDLFDRRYKVWEGMLKMTDLVGDIKYGKKDIKDVIVDFTELAISMTSVNFLFDDEISDHVREGIYLVEETMRTRDVTKYTEWLDKNQNHVIDLFKGYMDFSKL